MGQYEVAVEALEKHARHLEERADAVSEALRAAMAVSVSNDAYGVICQFLPPKINSVEDEGIAALRAAVDGLQEDAEHIRATATAYRGSDEGNAVGFDSGLAR